MRFPASHVPLTRVAPTRRNWKRQEIIAAERYGFAWGFVAGVAAVLAGAAGLLALAAIV